jgi:hypothetical protein
MVDQGTSDIITSSVGISSGIFNGFTFSNSTSYAFSTTVEHIADNVFNSSNVTEIFFDQQIKDIGENILSSSVNAIHMPFSVLGAISNINFVNNTGGNKGSFFSTTSGTVYFPTSSVNPGDMFQYLVDNAGLSPLL